MSLRKGTRKWLDLYIRDLTDAGRHAFLLRFGTGLTEEGLRRCWPDLDTSAALVEMVALDGRIREVCNALA